MVAGAFIASRLARLPEWPQLGALAVEVALVRRDGAAVLPPRAGGIYAADEAEFRRQGVSFA